MTAVVEDWMGGAALLGYLEINQRSLEIRQLLRQTDIEDVDALRQKLREISAAFSQAQLEYLQGGEALAWEIASSFQSKRIALVGFAPGDESRIAREYEARQAVVQTFSDGPAATADPAFAASDLIVLSLNRELDWAFWKTLRAAQRKAVLLVECSGIPMPAVESIPCRSQDILLEPWDTRELCLRSFRLLSAPAPPAEAPRPVSERLKAVAKWMTGRAFVLATWAGFAGFAAYVFIETPVPELVKAIAWLEEVTRWYVAMLLGWMIYNVLLYRWKGPRQISPSSGLDVAQDQLGKPVVLTRGTTLADSHLVVDIVDGKKVYSAFFPRSSGPAKPN